MTGDPPNQARLNVRVLELLQRSYELHVAGDGEGELAAVDEAFAVSPEACLVFSDAMMRGEIPGPPEDGWAEFVEGMRLLASLPAQECPVCGELPRVLVSSSQAMCGNDECRVLMWNPLRPDGGLSNPQFVDLLPPEPRE